MDQNNSEEFDKPQKKAKQVNIIRKTTIQTLKPVIEKIEDHIAYLLAQSTKLREKNQTLEKTVADHQVITNQLRETFTEITDLKINAKNSLSSQQLENDKTKKQLCALEMNIEQIQMELKKKQNKIKQLFEKNDEQIINFDASKNGFKEMVVEYSEKVEKIEEQNIKLSQKIKRSNENYTSKVNSLEKRIQEKESQYYKCEQKIMLYLQQREEIKNMMTYMSEKIDKTVELEKYERQWKIIRMENQQMKKQNKNMIDSALTPEVRKFLPEMLERMSELRKVNALEVQFNTSQQIQKQHTDKLIQIDNQLEKQNSQTLNFINELQAKKQEQLKFLDEKLLKQFQTKIGQLSINVEIKHNKNEQKIKKVEKQFRINIQQKEIGLQRQIDQLIDKNRTHIFQLVYDQIPQQEIDFFKKMKQFLPLLQATKTEILDRCDEITKFGQNLQMRLDQFSNRVVRIKSDMTMSVDGITKKNRVIEDSLMKINQDFVCLGKIISLYCEYFMLSYSASLNFGNEVFVTFNDGIICETNVTSEQLNYRKIKSQKEMFVRSALTTMTKLTDQLISSQEFSFLKIANHRPSDCFEMIKQGIMPKKVVKEKKQTISVQPSKEENKQQEVKIEVSKSSKKQKTKSHKLPSLDLNSSKTIDVTSDQKINKGEFGLLSQTLAGNDFKRSIHKKNDKAYRGRYSQNS